MKKQNIALITLVILLLIFGIWYFYFRIDISQADFKILAADALSNNEFKNILGNENVERTQVGPVQDFRPESYNTLISINSTCNDKLNVGDKIRVVDVFTLTRDIAVVYSISSNKFLCVAEAQINKS